MPDRAHAVALLEEWVKNEGLQNHMYAVEAAVRHYARLRGEDEDVWGLAGLLHDLDWEKFPGVEPQSELDKVLVACDELSGIVFACCLVRPNGIDDLKPKSVVKKLKDRTFAAGVSREEVAHGVELVGLERSEHIQNVIDGLRGIAEQLGIRAQDRAG